MGSSSARSSGSSSGSQPQNSRTGSQKGGDNGVDQQSSRDGCAQERASRAVECRAGKEQRRGGSSAEPPSSSPEACARQEDVWQLSRFARARAGCRTRGWQEGGGAAPKGAVLLELDGRGAAQPLEQLRIAG